MNRILLRNDEFPIWGLLIIPSGHYCTIEDVITKMNELVTTYQRFKDDMKFTFDPRRKMVTVHVQSNAEIHL